MQFYDQAPRPPPFNQTTQQECQSTGLELEIPKVLLIIRESGPVKFWTPPPQIPRLPLDPPPPTPSESTHLYTN